MTHLFTSTTELIWAHDRVRISWLQIAWMLNALIGVMIGWMGMFYLVKRPSWDAAVIAGWARPMWLQWLAALGILALDTYLLIIMYAI